MTMPGVQDRLDHAALISARARSIDVSGIRRVFELGASLRDPINLSIGQPDFAVPEPIKAATIEAIRADRNGYTLTQGAPELTAAISRRLEADLGWKAPSAESAVLVTAGTSGALLLAFLALLDSGDEVIVPDPFFVIYPALGAICGAAVRTCDTYPDFRMTAERVEPLLTARTKVVLVNSPGNPSGVVLRGTELRDLYELCAARGVLLISDEIYDEFTYRDARENGRCPSAARFGRSMLLVRGFGKSYGCTGWRLGWAAGPPEIIRQMAKLQQYTFVCAPSMAQVGIAGAFDVSIADHVEAYRRKRDMVVAAFDGVAHLVHPGGAFYAFIEVPPALGLTGTALAERAVSRNLLVIPGAVFSARDTHVRISYATDDGRLKQGLGVLRELMGG